MSNQQGQKAAAGANHTGTAPARRPIEGFALLVCTYKRPDFFRAFVGALRKVRIPEGLDFYFVVADNNPESHYDAYIKAELDSLPFPTRYGHEPKTGYSNARNKALDLALSTPADTLAFVDDDMLIEPDWLEGQLKTYAEFGCDCVAGTYIGPQPRFTHGQTRAYTGLGNTSFPRSWVTPDGLNLRFDPQYNKTGYEDRAFTSAAVKAGQVIVYSNYARVVDVSKREENWQEELANKAMVAVAAQHNNIARIRNESGLAVAVLAALAGLRFALKVPGLLLEKLAYRALGKPLKAGQSGIQANKEWSKFKASFRGLGGQYVARQDVRRGDTTGF